MGKRLRSRANFGIATRLRSLSLITFWAAATLPALLLFGCSRSESTLLDLIPGDSCAVVLIDWPSLSADRELKRDFKGNELETIFQRLSLNPSTVKSLASLAR